MAIAFSLPRTPATAAEEGLDALRHARIFFGHQSVGYNIIEGISDVMRQDGGKDLVFQLGREFPASSGPCFLHATIGRNFDPMGKIRDFDGIIRNGVGDRADIAFMKLCYVDVPGHTDVAALFDLYRSTLARLKRDFPKTTFVHFTVPLVSREKGLKPLVKRVLGRSPRGYASNVVRERLNAMLRREYGGTGLLFDLALFESTRPDGSRSASQLEGSDYYVLEDAYTEDGGHLNEKGRRFVAERLTVFLAGLKH